MYIYMNETVKESDVRFTTNSVFNTLKDLTNIEWNKNTYDPTPKNSKIDTLDLNWNKKEKIYLNPPFSRARFFIKKLEEQLIKWKSIKKVMIILPWYFVENKEERVTSGAKWYRLFINRIRNLFNVRQYHLKNQKFYNPNIKEDILVRVYGIYFKRKGRQLKNLIYK